MRILLSLYFLLVLLSLSNQAMVFDKSQEKHIANLLEIFSKVSYILHGNDHIKETIEELFGLAERAIDEGANINTYFSSVGYQFHYPLRPDHTYLHVLCNCTPIVKFLLLHGANVDAKDVWEETPLHCLLRDRTNINQESVRLLLEARANMNAQNWHGNTPLMILLEKSFTSDQLCIMVDGRKYEQRQMDCKIAITKLLLSYGIHKRVADLINVKNVNQKEITYFHILPADIIQYFDKRYYQEPVDLTLENGKGETINDIVQQKLLDQSLSNYTKEGYLTIRDLLQEHKKKYESEVSWCTLL